MKRKRTELVLLVLLYGLVFVHGFIHLSPTVTGQRMPFQTLVPIFALFSLLHAAFMLGWRRAAAFFAVATVLSLSAELAGVRTGLIFGRYVYTQALGPKFLADVPYVIPLAWFMMVYPAYVIASLALDGQPIAKGGRTRPAVLLRLGRGADHDRLGSHARPLHGRRSQGLGLE